MIKPLTSLRFIFALMVFASHLSFLETSDNSFLSSLFKNVLNEGYIGVTFFFILSGFILAYNYQEPLIKKSKSKSDFFIARIARIYPLHIICFFISIPTIYHKISTDTPIWLVKLGTNLTLTQSFFPFRSVYFSFNLPSWSISDEMFFYLVFPFLIGIFPKLYGHKFKVGILLLIIFFIPFLMLLIPEELQHQLFYINPFFRTFDFIIGIFLFNIFKKIASNTKKLNYNLIEFSAIFLLLAFTSIHSYIPQVLRFSVYYWIPMSLIIITFSFQKGIISKFLSNKFLFLLGEMSFGFYMFHLLILRYIVAINRLFIGIENEYIIILFTLNVTIIVSYFSFIWFETPTNKFIKRKWVQRKLRPAFYPVLRIWRRR